MKKKKKEKEKTLNSEEYNKDIFRHARSQKICMHLFFGSYYGMVSIKLWEETRKEES